MYAEQAVTALANAVFIGTSLCQGLSYKIELPRPGTVWYV